MSQRKQAISSAVRRTTVQPVVVKPKGRLTSVRNKFRNSVKSFDLTSFYNYTLNVVSDPTFLLLYCLSIYICYDYSNSHDKSHIFKFTKNLVTTFPSLSASACAVYNWIVAFIPFLPVILTVPPKLRIPTFIGTILYYSFIPERTVYEYLIHSVCIYLFIRTRNRYFRILSLSLLFLSYVMQFAIPLPANSVLVCNSTTFK
ncbi:ORF3 [Andrena haemorrhoa nege-like virus]|uniref:ORF3 n=1 Tax=Andrena haemorrhoa nege-like virus TaxID=2094259 RepID=A0A2L2P6U8_9VIRU|nr:ORF3 [Andrena haemorrhoa nege-like virus]AVH76847.1 ORF3 [Andrena haemorrhoa nege-like virus]